MSFKKRQLLVTRLGLSKKFTRSISVNLRRFNHEILNLVREKFTRSSK